MTTTEPAVQNSDARIDPQSMTVAQLAKVLGLPAENVRRHVDAGAPANADGRVNLVHYAAWLNHKLRENYGD